MKQLLLRVASGLTANHFAQSYLGNAVRLADHLMGVGSGSSVAESGEDSVLLRLRKPAKSPEIIVFDVGANQGQFLGVTLRRLAGISYQVHSFEPGKTAFALLSDTAKGLPGVTLNNFALGRASGEGMLFFDKPGSGNSSLTKRRLDHFGTTFGESETIHVETLDNYCQRNSIGHIDLLKIDVEGHEMDVLAGSAATLRRKAITYVMFEFGGANIDTRTFVQDFYYFFRDHDMMMARVTPGGFWFPMNDYREIYEQFRTTNFVAYSAIENEADDGSVFGNVQTRAKRVAAQ